MVGVNTTSPTLNGSQEGIHIVSDEYPTLHLTNMTTGHAASNGSMFTLNNTGETIIRNGHASHIRFDTNGSNERMRILSTGAVVVAGTSSYSDGTFGEAKLQFNTKSGNHIGACSVADATSNITHVLFKNPNGAIASVGTHNSDFIVLTGNSERMRIDSNGRVVIGHTAASTNYGKLLHIHNSAAAGASVHLTDNTTGTSNSDGFEIVMHNQTAYLVQREANSIIFMTDGTTERLRITAGGDTEIRNTVSGITNSYSQYLKFRTTQSNGQSAVTGAIRTQGKTNWGGDLVFYSKPNNSNANDSVDERLRILDSGRIAINITSSDARVTISQNANQLQPLIIRDANNTNSVTHYIGFRKSDSEVGSIKGDSCLLYTSPSPRD